MPGITIQIMGDGAGAQEALRVIEERMRQTGERGTEMGAQLAEAGERIKGAFDMVGIGLGIEQVVEGFKGMIEKSMELGVEIGHLHEQTGISVESLSTLKFISDRTGVSFETLTKGFKKLSTDMYEMESGAKKPTKAFADLGISQTQLAATGGDLMKVMELVADRFEKMPDGFEKNALATELFGKAGQQLIPILNKGAAGIEEMRAKAESLGVVLTEQGVEKMEAMHHAVSDLQSSLSGLALTLTAALAPALTDVSNKITKIMVDLKTNPAQGWKELLWGVNEDTAPGAGAKPAQIGDQSGGWRKTAGMSSTSFKVGAGDEDDEKATRKANQQDAEDARISAMIDEKARKELALIDQINAAKLKLQEAADASQLALDKSGASVRLAQLEAEHKAGLDGEIDFLERKLALEKATIEKEVAIEQQRAGEVGAAAAAAKDGSPKQLELQTQLVGINAKLVELADRRRIAETQTASAINEQLAAQKQQQAAQQAALVQAATAKGQGILDDQNDEKSKQAGAAAQTITKMLDQIASGTTTGKQNMKSMVDSMITDIERLAIKLMAEKWMVPFLNSIFGVQGGGSGGAWGGGTGTGLSPTFDDTAGAGDIPMDAGGGEIPSGGAAIVGDGGDGSGSELFMPSGPGTVLPHDVLAGIAKGGGGNGPVTPNVTINTVNNSSQPITQRQGAMSYDSEARSFVIQTVLEDMQQNGSLKTAMSG